MLSPGVDELLGGRDVGVKRMVRLVGGQAVKALAVRSAQLRSGRLGAALAQRADGGHQLAGEQGAQPGHHAGRCPGRLRREGGVLLGAARQHGGAEGGRRGELPQFGKRGAGCVLKDHDSRAALRPGSQKRPQASPLRVGERGQPGRRERGIRAQRQPGAVEREREVGAVEVAVVQHLAAAHVDERVLRGGVQLGAEHPLDLAERVGRGTVHLGQRTQPVRVLHPGAGTGGVRAEQLAQPPRGTQLARVRPRRLHLFRIRLSRAGQREMAEGRDAQLRVEQCGQVVVCQRGLRQRHRVGRQERERVGVGHRRGEQRAPLRARGAAPRPLADERERGRGQPGQVAGADRAENGELRGQAGVERRRHRLDPGRVGTGAAGRQLVEPDRQRAACHVGGRRLTRSAGVAAQQPQSVPVARRYGHAVVGADPGGPAVEGVRPYRVERGPLRRGGPRHPFRRRRDRHAPAGHGGQRVTPQRGAVQHHRALRVHLASAPSCPFTAVRRHSATQPCPSHRRPVRMVFLMPVMSAGLMAKVAGGTLPMAAAVPRALTSVTGAGGRASRHSQRIGLSQLTAGGVR